MVTKWDCARWLISFLQDPNKMHNDKETLIRVSQGCLLVHVKALIIFWKTYQTNVSPPAASTISSTLSDLSDGRKQLKDGRGRPTYYRKIRTELLLAWNQENGYAVEEEIMSALSKNTQGEY